MAKKLKALARPDTESLAATIRESANQIWLAGLGALHPCADRIYPKDYALADRAALADLALSHGGVVQ